MKVLKPSSQSLGLDPYFESSVVTIGNFDGCHRGHQELIKLTRHWADVWNLPSVVLTFDPNPKEFFQPSQTLGRLFQSQQKIRALEELGISAVVIQEFDKAFSLMQPLAFYHELLKERLKARSIIVGHDFRFGVQRKGDAQLLSQLASSDGIAVHIVGQQLDQEGEVISSSLIRKMLKEGELKQANRMLGRAYMLEGRVVTGRKLGRQLGFPTANIDCDSQLLPAFGVYAGHVTLGGGGAIFKEVPNSVPCVLNIGLKPTVDQQIPQPTVEVHLLEGRYSSDELYGQELSVYLKEFIRKEQKFPSLEALRTQIARDCDTAMRLLRFS